MSSPDRYAVFGHPIKHSKSPKIHQLFAEQTGQRILYTAEDVTVAAFVTAVNNFFAGEGKGLNCTVPLKELAWELADHKTQRAELSKAVNTLALRNDGTILGDNTDGVGLVTDLTVNNAIGLNNISILILGAGGATRGIIGPLLDQGPRELVIANRTITKAINLAGEFGNSTPITGCGFDELSGLQFDLILNATSASLSNQLPPLPEGILATEGNCYDLAYGAEPTPFVRWGGENNAAKSLDGLGMLVEQAAEAFYLWHGVRPDTRPVIDLLDSSKS